MNIKIDNMIDLRAFCLEQAVALKSAYETSGNKQPNNAIQIARYMEQYILQNCTLPDQPFNSDKLLYDTMTDMIKNKGENDVKKRIC